MFFLCIFREKETLKLLPNIFKKKKKKLNEKVVTKNPFRTAND